MLKASPYYRVSSSKEPETKLYQDVIRLKDVDYNSLLFRGPQSIQGAPGFMLEFNLKRLDFVITPAADVLSFPDIISRIRIRYTPLRRNHFFHGQAIPANDLISNLNRRKDLWHCLILLPFDHYNSGRRAIAMCCNTFMHA
jgi:hypothetical protein